METHYLQQQSTEVLLKNDFGMAKLLCKLEVSGDKAATMASHLISFLRGNPATSSHVEDFVIGAFDTHLRRYAAMPSNPRNILRDNNLATMLVVCYLQQTCRTYLVSILQPVMEAIDPFVENCELDPVRLTQNPDPSASSKNLYNLYCVCRSVLDAVFSAGKHAPMEMQRLCTILRMRIEATWGTPVTPMSVKPKKTAPILPPAPQLSLQNNVQEQEQQAPELPKKESQQSMLEMAEWETNLKTTVDEDIMSDIKSALDEWLKRPGSGTPRHSSRTSSSANTNSGRSWLPSPSAKRDDEFGSETRQSLVQMMSSSFSSMPRLDTSLAVKATTSSIDNVKEDKKVQSPVSPVKPEDTWRQTQENNDKRPSSRGNMNPALASCLSKHTSRRYSGSYFTPVETVISMLIFVRYFIPILTSPDAYGIDVTLSPAKRRGMLLCAKFVAVLCNGVSFGAKVPYLVPMNGLLREYRPKLRHYLHKMSSQLHEYEADESKRDEEDGVNSEDDESSDGSEENNECDTLSIDELVSQFQVISVGAEIGTKEEQRKSRMSFVRVSASADTLTFSHETPYACGSGSPPPPVPPLPKVPPIPYNDAQLPSNSKKSYEAPPTTTSKGGVRARQISEPPVSPTARATIDLPIQRPALNKKKAAGPKPSQHRVDNQMVDESLVTLDFLVSLEGSFEKIETLIEHSPDISTAEEKKKLLRSYRELKPIVQYAKHLSSSSSTSRNNMETSNGSNQQQQQQQGHGRRFHLPFVSHNNNHATTSTAPGEFEKVGHRRTSTLPGDIKF